MPAISHTTVEPVQGEPTRFYVSTGGEPYLVDLEEFGGVGQCGCSQFDFRLRPRLEEAQERRAAMPMLRCKHIEAAVRWVEGRK